MGLLWTAHQKLPICAAVRALYVVLVGCWSGWLRAVVLTRTLLTLPMLAGDVAVVSVISVLDPVDRGAQLDPVISGVVACPR